MKIRLALGLMALAALTACGGGGNTSSTPTPTTNETTRVIAFGDSLTDGGTYSRGNSAILQSFGVPGADANLVGKFTNSPGEIWVEVLARKLGVTITAERFEMGAASLVAGTNASNAAVTATNYAQGGSRVAKVPGVGCNPNPQGVCTAQAAVPVVTQIDRALAKGNFNGKDLVVIWAGANDVFFQAGVAGQEIEQASRAAGRALTAAETQAIVGKYVIAMEEAALDTLAQVRRVKAAGAERVLVMTIPNAANSPLGNFNPTTKPLFTALSDAYNNQLKKEVALNDPGVLLFDAAALSLKYYTDPAGSGFTNTAVPICKVPPTSPTPPFPALNAWPLGNSSSFCVSSFTAFINPVPAASSLFADVVHPSLVTHAKFGDAVYEALRAKQWVK